MLDINGPRLFARLPSMENLVCFEAVARCGSFTRAAQELSLTQSAVSKQMAMLEDSLKTSLFDRVGRGIRLSARGRELQSELQPLLLRLNDVVARLRSTNAEQSVAVRCTQAVAHSWLFPQVVYFNQDHPEINVNIIASNSINEESCSDGSFGILYGDGNWNSLDATPLFPEVVYAVCRPDLPLPPIDTVEQLRDAPLIQLDSREWNCMDWPAWFSQFGVEYTAPTRALTFNQVTLVYNAALQGLGVGLGWDYMVRESIDRGQLRTIGNFACRTGRYDYLVHSRHRTLSPAARLFREWLLQRKPLWGQS
ncbi:LysR family transcriptional regulator [Bordetella genomosp. 9]|uniref:LysR family transcriptional regulator n=2 Tax=Bordetella genomosp. 9 TaxID=1416803 RepID=A0A261RQ20_9BORD|nr:LysR family transcriptional regulator [Bordetella genomosp. 9]